MRVLFHPYVFYQQLESPEIVTEVDDGDLTEQGPMKLGRTMIDGSFAHLPKPFYGIKPLLEREDDDLAISLFISAHKGQIRFPRMVDRLRGIYRPNVWVVDRQKAMVILDNDGESRISIIRGGSDDRDVFVCSMGDYGAAPLTMQGYEEFSRNTIDLETVANTLINAGYNDFCKGRLPLSLKRGRVHLCR